MHTEYVTDACELYRTEVQVCLLQNGKFIVLAKASVRGDDIMFRLYNMIGYIRIQYDRSMCYQKNMIWSSEISRMGFCGWVKCGLAFMQGLLFKKRTESLLTQKQTKNPHNKSRS